MHYIVLNTYWSIPRSKPASDFTPHCGLRMGLLQFLENNHSLDNM